MGQKEQAKEVRHLDAPEKGEVRHRLEVLLDRRMRNAPND